MATQNARIRQRLGAEIARVADKQGLKTQEALAQAASIGLRTVVAVQRGEKVSARTLRKIENTLKLPTGSTDDFLEEKIDELVPLAGADQRQNAAESEEPAGLHDEVERKLWAIDELSEEDRWTYIYEYRARQQAVRATKAG